MAVWGRNGSSRDTHEVVNGGNGTVWGNRGTVRGCFGLLNDTWGFQSPGENCGDSAGKKEEEDEVPSD